MRARISPADCDGYTRVLRVDPDVDFAYSSTLETAGDQACSRAGRSGSIRPSGCSAWRSLAIGMGARSRVRHRSDSQDAIASSVPHRSTGGARA